jgi:hypothetical protein
MNRLLLLALTAVLLSTNTAEAFWKHGSLHEAKKACEKWLLAGPQYRFESLIKKGEPNYDPNNLTKRNLWGAYLRKCTVEKETNQVLGFLNTDIKEGRVYHLKHGLFKNVPEKKNFELIKRFKY